MTRAADVPGVRATDAADAVELLRRSGTRLSTVRRLIVEALFHAHGPVSASELAQRLHLEESSVYRNLEMLEQHGLARHVHLGHGPGLYARIGKDDDEYLFCERCGKVTVLASDELAPIREELESRFGHSPRFSHFALVGVCEDCARIPR
jgi:Fur family transcriptional regulator, ferric uptake regulator